MLSRIDRYIFREIVVPFGLTLAALMLVLLTDQLIRLVDLVANKGIGGGVLFRIFFWILPPFLVISVPAAVLIGVIVAFNRLSTDNEVIALQAGGISLARLIPPALLFSALAFAVTFGLSVWTHPWAGRSIKELAVSILKNHINLLIEPQSFNEPFNNMVFFVEGMPSPERMTGILIHDLRDPDAPVLTLAREGAVTGGAQDGRLGFTLLDGNQYRFDAGPSARQQHLRFSRYEFRMTVDEAIAPGSREAGETNPDKLRQAIREDPERAPRYRRLLEEHYKNYAYPFSCLIFGLVGVPAGITFRRTGRLGGFALGLLLGTAYYFFIFIGDYLATSGRTPPLLSAWLPNLIMLAIALWAVRRISAGEGRLRSWIDRI